MAHAHTCELQRSPPEHAHRRVRARSPAWRRATAAHRAGFGHGRVECGRVGFGAAAEGRGPSVKQAGADIQKEAEVGFQSPGPPQEEGAGTSFLQRAAPRWRHEGVAPQRVEPGPVYRVPRPATGQAHGQVAA
eukprot:6873638-Prymnesium_polylepis.2